VIRTSRRGGGKKRKLFRLLFTSSRVRTRKGEGGEETGQPAARVVKAEKRGLDKRGHTA